jgi:hypothetical protein
MQAHHHAPPFVRVHPSRIEGEPSLAAELPEGANLISLDAKRPLAHTAQLLTIEFDTPWSRADLPM